MCDENSRVQNYLFYRSAQCYVVILLLLYHIIYFLIQSEHIGHSLYDLIHEDDHYEAKRSLTQAESRILARQGIHYSIYKLSYIYSIQ